MSITKENIALAEELSVLGKSVAEKKELEGLLEVTQEEYLACHHPKPKKKAMIETSQPSLKPFFIKAAIAAALIIVCVSLVISIIASLSAAKKLTAVAENPGKEYEAWLASWATVSTFEELEEGWKPVEKAWKKRGVDFDWKKVEEVKETLPFLDSVRFNKSILGSLKSEASDKGDTSVKIMFIFFAVIPMIIFTINAKAKYDEWKEGTAQHEKNVQENKERARFNEAEYPKLLAEYEEKLPEMIERYLEAGAIVRNELEEANAQIAKRSDILPLQYHDHAEEIATIILNMRAESLKEAINVFEQDQHAARMQAMELERIENEARHQETMRRQAAEQARAAAEAQQRMLRDQAERERSEAYRRCRACAHYGNCRVTGQINCGGFRPK